MPNYLSLNSSDYELRQTAFSSNSIQGKGESSNEDISVFENTDTFGYTDEASSVETLREEFENAKKEQGFFGKAWDGIKNFFGHKNGSDAIEETIEKAEKGEISLSEAEEAIEKYRTKQDSMVSLVANIASGITVAAVGVATGGLGFLAAAGVGAAVKVGIEGGEKATNNIEGDYTLKDGLKDAASGAVNGVLSVVTFGGVTNAGTIVASSTKEAVKQGVITGAKAGAIDGAVSNSADYAIECAFEEDKEFSAAGLASSAVSGAVGGAVMGGALGGVTYGVKFRKDGIEVIPANKSAKTYQESNALEQTEVPGLEDKSFLHKELKDGSYADIEYYPNGKVKRSTISKDGKVAVVKNYDGNGRLDTINDAQGRILETHTHKGNGKVDSIDYANGSARKFSYNDDGSLKREIYLDAETNKVLDNQAESLAKEYSGKVSEAQKQIEEVFGSKDSVAFADEAKTHRVGARSKGESSIKSKLKSKFEKGKLKTTDIDDCRGAIGDAYGTRLRMKNLNPDETQAIVEDIIEHNDVFKKAGITYADVKNYFEGGATLSPEISTTIEQNISDILDPLKEAQNKEVFDALIDAIQNNKKIKITELNNYGDEYSSYFTRAQIDEIARIYKEKTGSPLNLVTQATEESGEKFGAKGTIFEKATDDGAIKASGYTSSQMNVEHTFADGTTGNGELQVRGTMVHEFAEVEHIPYDIRQGKITPDHKDYAKYKDIMDAIKKMDEKSFDAYNEYLTDTYRWLRLNELGISSQTPHLTYRLQTEAGGVSEYIPQEIVDKLTFEGLIKLH